MLMRGEVRVSWLGDYRCSCEFLNKLHLADRNFESTKRIIPDPEHKRVYEREKASRKRELRYFQRFYNFSS